jgi:hypothetical protein
MEAMAAAFRGGPMDSRRAMADDSFCTTASDFDREGAAAG